MAGLARTFGIAVQNFTAYPQMPDVKALVEYGVRMEQLGFDSLWVWDHILLGVEPNFPIIESLTLLTAIAARTSTRWPCWRGPPPDSGCRPTPAW